MWTGVDGIIWHLITKCYANCYTNLCKDTCTVLIFKIAQFYFEKLCLGRAKPDLQVNFISEKVQSIED